LVSTAATAVRTAIPIAAATATPPPPNDDE
jgi:hypothetical protein